MFFTEPIPFAEALEYTQVQTILRTVMRSWEIEELQAQIRERAFFSAGVENAEFLQAALNLVDTLVAGTIDRATARHELRQFVRQSDPEALLTDNRLNLILDTNVAQATGYGRWKSLETPALNGVYPVRELYRAIQREEPRPWLEKWQAAGGTLYNGRMLALKDDPIWMKSIRDGGFNRFGNPYPPFDFNSGMRTRPVKRAQAVELGVLAADSPQATPVSRGLNDTLQQTPAVRSAALKQAIVAGGVGQFDSGGVLRP